MTANSRTTPSPEEIVVHKKSRQLEVAFDDGSRYKLAFELLRVYSPSAEVRGHGIGQEVLQTGKREVTIEKVEPVGHYALKPTFSDGHESGLYSWDYLKWLGENQEKLWNDYLRRLTGAAATREAGDAESAAGRDGSTADRGRLPG